MKRERETEMRKNNAINLKAAKNDPQQHVHHQI